MVLTYLIHQVARALDKTVARANALEGVKALDPTHTEGLVNRSLHLITVLGDLEHFN